MTSHRHHVHTDRSEHTEIAAGRQLDEALLERTKDVQWAKCHESYKLSDKSLHRQMHLIYCTITFVMPVRLSVRIEQLGSHWTDFH